MATKVLIFTGLTSSLPPATSFQASSSSADTLSIRPLATSFFNGGVGALKVTWISISPSNRSRCSRQGGGALGARMNLFDRFARVAKSYANAIISSFEDPEKILEQTVLEMNDDLIKMRQATAQILESKIQEAKTRKDTLKACAQSAKTASKVNEMLGPVNTSSALGAFEKMEEKVLAMESQAEALGQLTTDDLAGKFALLESSSVDDDLADLKKELSGSSMKGELLPGRQPVTGTKTAFPFQDTEIESEPNELRRKAKDL